METIVFVGTVIMCTCIIVISEILDRISGIEKYNKTLEKVLQQKFEKISSIEEYNKSLETVLQQNYEHIMLCILYKTVHIPEPIHGIKIMKLEGPHKFVTFTDVLIVNTNDEQILCNINQDRSSNGYRCCQYSTNNDNRKDLMIEFCPTVFKYIEFYDLKIGDMHVGLMTFVYIVLLSENYEISIKIKQKDRNIIYNTALIGIRENN